MSVAKSGSDDANCRFTNRDVLHQAICRLYARHHGRRRSSQRAAERGRLRPGGLQPGHHGLGPGRYGRQSRPGRQPLLLVGRLRPRRHVRRLQQLRIGCRPDRAGQVHLVDQARSDVRLLVRDVDGAPAVTGAVACLSRPARSRPRRRSASPCVSATRAGTPTRTRILSRAPARCGPSGRSAFSLVADGRHHHVEGRTVLVPVSVSRSSTFFERVRLTVSGVPAGGPRRCRRRRADHDLDLPARHGPIDGQTGTYHMQIPARTGRTKSTSVTVEVADRADRKGAGRLGADRVEPGSVVDELQSCIRTSWSAATDPSDTDRALRGRAQRQRVAHSVGRG